MRNRGFIFLLLGLFLLCTSCFEIVEEVTFSKNGSGTISLTVNLSRSKTKMSSILLLDSINSYKVPSEKEIRKKIDEIVTTIKETKGVSGVEHSLDFENYIAKVSCDFKNVETLNQVISAFGSKAEAEKIRKTKHFSYNPTTKIFERNYHYDLEKAFGKTKMEDRKVVENASFTTIYKFETPIATFKNKEAKLSKSKKAIFLRVGVQDIIKNHKTIKNKIQLAL